MLETKPLEPRNWYQNLKPSPLVGVELEYVRRQTKKSQVFAFCTSALETATAEDCTGIVRGPLAPQADPEISRAREEQSA